MTDLTPLTALGTPAAQSARFASLTLRENPGLALASLALRRGATAPAPFGLALPGPGQWARSGAISAFWMAPGQWMIEAESRADGDFATELVAHGQGCSVTDQTDGFVCFEITSNAGPGPVERLLERLVNLDLTAFGPGSATRKGYEHMSIFVIRRAADHVAVLGLRSAAGSIWHGLTTAAQRLQGEMA